MGSYLHQLQPITLFIALVILISCQSVPGVCILVDGIFFPTSFTPRLCIPSSFSGLSFGFYFFFSFFLASVTADNFSFCVCDDELPSYSVHLPLGASHISMQHPLTGGPWSGSGIGPGGSGTPFLLDGGKVTLWQLAAKETPKFYLFQTKHQRQLCIFLQPNNWST